MKNLLKTLAIIGIPAVMFSAEFDIQKARAGAIIALDKDIAILQSAKECVNKASNKPEFEACKQKAKIDMQAAKSSAKEVK